jgi:anaerobic selenocysteine-containing dehydrogenase
MPDLDDSGSSAVQGPSRRFVLKGAAGVGAAGIAATALAGVAAPASAAVRASSRAASTDRIAAPDEATDDTIVVHLRDVASGEIDVYRGTTQARIHDRDLAARLVRLSQ